MSPDGLQSIIENIEILMELNKKILEGLQKGRALDNLDTLFSSKATALQALNLATASLASNSIPDSASVARAHTSQALLARLEVQLAEALGNIQSKQKNVSAVTKAYSDPTVDKLGINGVNIVS